MAAVDVRIPEDLWDEDVEGVLLGWLFADGARVPHGEAVVELMTEKVQSEIAAPVSGRLEHLVAEDSPVRKGDVIGRVHPEGGVA